MRRSGRWLMVVVAGLVVAVAGGCATSGPSVSATAGTAAPIVLRQTPDDIGCDAIGVPYRSVTFTIDPAANEDVTAITDLGAGLVTYWPRGFRGGTADDPVVYDRVGNVVVTDGQVLVIPDGAWPSLAGYFVCPSLERLFVMDDPA